VEKKKDFKKSGKGFKKGKRGRFQKEEIDLSKWIPKTQLGKDVVAGKYKTLSEVLSKGEIILEPEVVDYLVPDLKDELIYIGGTPGKGGGIRRTPTRMTARMHKSGRRFKLTALIVVGNEDGIIGIGRAVSNEHRVAISKALAQAKLNVINVKRGCGSWECNCGGKHSIPYKSQGKTGSVKIKLSPTPTGVGIVADNETKKIIRLAGVNDVWVKAFGKTSTRINLAFAVFEALKNLSNTKGDI
ncbi:MAG: 30S ribosomal protein S5, partial [Candidatus Aenigmarchaeota archaeon]|nr:30S ribosomal protein S5 [Candidatus Aenigmarchaeota archaeon]